MFLCGSYSHQLDDKNRIRLPSRLRAELGEKYILLPGPKGFIYLVNADDPQTIIKSLGLLESLNPDSEEHLRTLLSASSIVEVDAQGRFKLPDNLIAFANIKKDVLINGNISKVEIWSAESWEARNKTVDSTPKGIEEIYRILSAKRPEQN
ncbi:MAG: cell division/cell wall cluster transcriptional repressor MraZ [Clostridia bacterium]|nr:cell division/cell wall cluster transcriptional repressor MraZ [Clostridia bacterium]